MKEIPIFGGRKAMVDDDDFAHLSRFKWHLHQSKGSVYVARIENDKVVKMHREIMGFPDIKVDHRDGDGLNNQRKNLRRCTQLQNSANRRINNNNKSGFKGVRIIGRRFQARIRVSGRLIEEAGFNTAIDAARRYDELAKLFFGEFSRLNFPNG